MILDTIKKTHFLNIDDYKIIDTYHFKQDGVSSIYLGCSEFKMLFCPYFLQAQPSSVVGETITHESEVLLNNKKKSINHREIKVTFHTEKQTSKVDLANICNVRIMNFK